jgi:LmbE family N-acetylglucosaminyl deacetylase
MRGMSAGYRVLRGSDDVADGRLRVVNVVPHPDDEAIGCPATMRRLQELGFVVEILAVGFGRPDQERRRRGELLASADRAGFTVLAPEEPINLSDRADVAGLETDVRLVVESVCASRLPRLVIGPHPHDSHPAHELVGRAVLQALEGVAEPPTLWMWSIWADLARPTLYCPFDEGQMADVLDALTAYHGENDRNDYRQLVQGRALANRIIGSERVFGFGSGTASPALYAELLTEVVHRRGEWLAGMPRVFEDTAVQEPGDEDIRWLLNRPSYAAESVTAAPFRRAKTSQSLR